MFLMVFFWTPAANKQLQLQRQWEIYNAGFKTWTQLLKNYLSLAVRTSTLKHALHLPLNTKADLYPSEAHKRRILIALSKSNFSDPHQYCFLISACLLKTASAAVRKTFWTCFKLLKSPHLQFKALHPVMLQKHAKQKTIKEGPSFDFSLWFKNIRNLDRLFFLFSITT